MASLVGFTYFLLGLFVLMGVVIMGFVMVSMFTHRLRIRDPIRKDTYITDLWVWEKKDKDTGIIYWQWGKKIKTPKPPIEAINVGKRGRKFAEAYQLSADELVWITDKGIKIIEKQVEVIGKDGKPLMIDGKPVTRKEMQIVDLVPDEKEEGKVIYKFVDTFKPYTAVQRETLIAQHKKADDIKRNKWTADKIVTITAIGALVMMVVCLMIFWGDIAKPALQAQSVATKQMQINSDVADKQARLMEAMGYDVEGYEISQTAKTQKTGNVIKTEGEEPPKAKD